MEFDYIASKLYELSKDMDFADYEEQKDLEIANISNALENLYNSNKTEDIDLFECIERIANNN